MPQTRWRNKQESVGRRKAVEERGKTSEEVVPSGDNLMTQMVPVEANTVEQKVNRMGWDEGVPLTASFSI